MNLRHIEVFLAVVDSGGFTAASERLRIAQPAVSVTIKNLEKDLGTTLLVRRRRRVTLTSEGSAFARHARMIVTQVLASRREMEALKGLEVGHLTIGAPSLIGGFLLPKPIERFVSKYPGIRVSVVLGGSEEIVSRVQKGELDLGLVIDWHVPKELAARSFKVLPMVACVSQNSPLAGRQHLQWSQVVQQPLILFPHGYYQRARIEDAATKLGRTLDIKAETACVPVMLELVRRGHGIATVVKDVVDRDSGIRLLALPRSATLPVAMCYRQGNSRSRAAKIFEDYLITPRSD